jgi:hypothetical protein
MMVPVLPKVAGTSSHCRRHSVGFRLEIAWWDEPKLKAQGCGSNLG